MPTDRFVVIGAGGHAKVVMDALLRAFGDQVEAVFADDNPALAGSLLLERAVQVPIPVRLAPGDRVHVAIGDNRVRQRLAERLAAGSANLLRIVHPDASVSRFAEIDEGVFIAARAVVGPGSQVAAGTIVNHGAVVDHDCRVGAFSHVAPTATLGGGVRVGCRVLVGSGAVVRPGVVIGDDAVIGAGAVVVADVAAGVQVVGVPARAMREGRRK